MTKSDIIIVGAGPAGSTAAYLLSNHGFDVTIIDKDKFPRTKLCGGALSRSTITFLKSNFHTNFSSDFPSKVIDEVEFKYRKLSILRKKLNGAPMRLIDRSDYDNYLLGKAMDAGANFEVDRVEHVNKRSRVVCAGKHDYGYDILIGADGANSFVRGVVNPTLTRRFERAITVGVSIDKKYVDIEVPTTYSGYMAHGYAWAFPGVDKVNLGIGDMLNNGHIDIVGKFKQFLKDIGVNTKNIPKIKGHPIYFSNNTYDPTECPNILLIGDAAGVANPFTGEGIYQAHGTAKAVADAAWFYYADEVSKVASHYDYCLTEQLYPMLSDYKKIASWGYPVLRHGWGIPVQWLMLRMFWKQFGVIMGGV